MSFPVVMKQSGENNLLEIIYINRTEIYKLIRKDVCDGYHEIEMARGSGFKLVHDKSDEAVWRFK